MIVEVGSEDLQIRLAAAEDADAIAAILLEAFSQFESDYTPEAFVVVTPKADEIATRFDEGPMWVAVKDDEVVGTVSVLPEPEWLYIRSMAVSPKAQGLGIGYRLLDAVEECAIANGFDRLFLYTTYFSTGAIQLYEKHGFKRGRDTAADEWFGTPGLAMEKKIGRNIKQNVIRS